jgi:AhpD family alkylhydroperoxidase
MHRRPRNPSLKAAKASFGFVPNLQGTMAESPELLAGYSTLWDLFAKTTLTPHEQEVVYMTSNFENECHYCVAGHTALAKLQKVDPAVIDALRNGTEIPDRKLEALHRFTALVVRTAAGFQIRIRTRSLPQDITVAMCLK